MKLDDMAIGRVRIRLQDDPLDQSAQNVDRFSPRALVVQSLSQLRHLARVDIRKAGMEGCGFRFTQRIEGHRKGAALCFKGIHLCLHAWMVHAFRDGGDNVVDLL